MYSGDPIWLNPENITKMFNDFCFFNHIDEKRIVKLFDAHLLRGNDNRQTRKIEILQESFEELREHIKYQRFKLASKIEAKLKMPIYCKYKYRIYYDRSNHLYTPTELLKTYSDVLRHEKHFTVEFIGELVTMGMLIGKYKPSENCYLVFLPSFVELLKFREYNIDKMHILPPPFNKPPEAHP